MKRSELTVGLEVYYSRATSWQTDKYGGDKAVVLAVEPYSAGRAYAGKANHYPDPTGKGVFVRISRGNSGTYEAVVPAAHLRGPYESTKAEVEKSVAVEAERRAVEDRKRNDVWAEARAVVDRCIAAGIYARTNAGQTGGPEISLRPDALAKLLDAYTR